MELLVDALELAISDVSVDLSSADTRMAQEELDGTQIGAVMQKICSKRMTNNVRSDFLRYTGFHSPVFHYALHRTRVEGQIRLLRSLAIEADEQGIVDICA